MIARTADARDGSGKKLTHEMEAITHEMEAVRSCSDGGGRGGGGGAKGSGRANQRTRVQSTCAERSTCNQQLQMQTLLICTAGACCCLRLSLVACSCIDGIH
jgi:hypothetical protein